MASRRLIDVSHIAVFGNVDGRQRLLRACFDAGIPILWFTAGGWLSGFAQGMPPKNVRLRIRQHRSRKTRSARTGRRVRYRARSGTRARFCVGTEASRPRGPSSQLAELARKRERSATTRFATRRSRGQRHDSTSSASATLSAPRSRRTSSSTSQSATVGHPGTPSTRCSRSSTHCLIKDTTAAALAAGPRPVHRPLPPAGFGRPALALDLAEEFRPLIGDSTVMTRDQQRRGPGRRLHRPRRRGRAHDQRPRKLIAAYERRMATELRHPMFGYRASYRRTLEIQARLLAAALVGDVAATDP